jgi:hypothetical protein
MSYIYEKTPEPITLDVYPDAAEPSNYVMYDCDTPKASPIKETSFMCLESRTEIVVSIDKSNVAYELWVHYDKQPASGLENCLLHEPPRNRAGIITAAATIVRRRHVMASLIASRFVFCFILRALGQTVWPSR